MPLRLTLGADASEWAIAGNYQDCREGLARCRDEMGLTHVTCQFHNLPESLSARHRVSRRLWVRGDPEARDVEYWASQRYRSVINTGVLLLKSFGRSAFLV